LKSICFIGARGGSKGVPRKNIRKLGKKPLIAYTIESALKSNLFEHVIVSTEDTEIANISKKFGAEVIKRPNNLALDKSLTEPVMFHVLKYLKQNDNYIPDVVILLQNTSPFRIKKHIDDAFALFFKNNYDSVLSGFLSSEFIWINKNKQSIPINYELNKRPQRQNIKHAYVENGAIYITKYKKIMHSKCRISGKIGMFLMPQNNSIEIDEQNDLRLARKMLKSKMVNL